MKSITKIVLIVVLIAAAAGAYFYFQPEVGNKVPSGFAFGNGRVEAIEIDVAAKSPGRILKISADEGDYVKEGEVLAVMQTSTLEADLAEARAQLRRAETDAKSAAAQIAVRISDKKVSESLVRERLSALDAATRRYNRSKALVGRGGVSREEFDNDETSLNGAKAAVASARAQVAVAQSAIEAAMADAESRSADIQSAQARIARIETDLDDCYLKAPRSGRVQYRIAQPGEIVGAGGKLLNVVDLSDVYMTFYLSEEATGRTALSADARIVLDALPDQPVPATISFVSSVAQFTPKTVETQSERQKLMFRIKARVPVDFLERHADSVKTGMPGVAWVRLDPEAAWPASLTVRESEK